MNKNMNGTSLLRRYKWDDLSDPEKEAVSDALGIAATRATVGIGVVLTGAAIISNARRGKASLPAFVRYGSVSFFSIVGAYAGFLSAGPIYAQRILSVPNSRLAEDLRIVIGDWQAKVPSSPSPSPEQPSTGESEETPLGPPPPAQDFSEHSQQSKSIGVVNTNGSKDNQSSRSATYWLGLTKS